MEPHVDRAAPGKKSKHSKPKVMEVDGLRFFSGFQKLDDFEVQKPLFFEGCRSFYPEIICANPLGEPGSSLTSPMLPSTVFPTRCQIEHKEKVLT